MPIRLHVLAATAALATLLGGSAALALNAAEQRAYDMMVARGFSDIAVDSTGNVIRASGERDGKTWSFTYNRANGRLMGGDDAGHHPILNANEDKIIAELKRRGYTDIHIRQTGAVLWVEAQKGGKTYDVKYNTANGKVMAEREVTAASGPKPGNGNGNAGGKAGGNGNGHGKDNGKGHGKG